MQTHVTPLHQHITGHTIMHARNAIVLACNLNPSKYARRVARSTLHYAHNAVVASDMPQQMRMV